MNNTDIHFSSNPNNSSPNSSNTNNTSQNTSVNQTNINPINQEFVLLITDAAKKRLQDLLSAQQNPNLKLRVGITGGGCSGFQYDFKLDEGHKDGDRWIDEAGVRVVVDAKSLPYLKGSTLDYQSSLTQSQFVVQNPNATATCGCGSSFTLKECNNK